MKVTLVSKTLKLKHAWTLARGSTTSKDYLYFKVEHQGFTGWGEAAHNARYGESPESVKTVLEEAKTILEADPEAVHRWQAWLPSLPQAQAAARAAVDIACRDWVTQASSTPFLPAAPDRELVTSFSVGIDAPERIRAKVPEASTYHVLKIKLGTKQDQDIISAVREATDKPLRVDANEGWRDREEALQMIDWLAARGIELIEQPMPTGQLENIAWLRERSPLPLVADEDICAIEDIDRLAGVYDGINVKLMKAGGATPAAAMLEKARTLGLKTMLGCMIESSIGITAASFLAPKADWIDLDGNLLISNDPFIGTTCQEGKLVLPTRRLGLGVEERPDALP